MGQKNTAGLLQNGARQARRGPPSQQETHEVRLLCLPAEHARLQEGHQRVCPRAQIREGLMDYVAVNATLMI